MMRVALAGQGLQQVGAHLGLMSRREKRTEPSRRSGSSSGVCPSSTIPMSTTRLLVAPWTMPTTVLATLLLATSTSTSM